MTYAWTQDARLSRNLNVTVGFCRPRHKGRMTMKCSHCGGDGWTSEHDTGAYSHDGEGNCLGYCPVQVQCEKCNGTGEVT